MQLSIDLNVLMIYIIQYKNGERPYRPNGLPLSLWSHSRH